MEILSFGILMSKHFCCIIHILNYFIKIIKQLLIYDNVLKV